MLMCVDMCSDFSFARITMNPGLAVNMYHELSLLIRNTVLHNHGLLVDWHLAVFSKVVDAVWASLQLRELVRNHNARSGLDHKSEERWILNGIGLASGSLLYVPSTDIAFGDPLNVSAKLAIDVCKHEQILITAEPFDPVKEKMLRVISEPVQVKIGGVGTTPCYELQKIHVLKKVTRVEPKFDRVYG